MPSLVKLQSSIDLDTLIQQPPTEGQRHYLQRHGYPEAKTFDDASKVIGCNERRRQSRYDENVRYQRARHDQHWTSGLDHDDMLDYSGEQGHY